MGTLILAAKPAIWNDDPDPADAARTLPTTRTTFGVAWTYRPPAAWLCYRQSEVGALWKTLSRPNLRLVGWDLQAHDLPLVRRAARQPHAPLPADVLDLAVLIANTTGRRYELNLLLRANNERPLAVTDNEIAQWVASGSSSQLALAQQQCRLYVARVAALYVHLLEGKPLVLPARPAQPGEMRLLFFLERDGSARSRPLPTTPHNVALTS